LFHAATVPGLPPFRAFPSRRSCTPLEATGSLAVSHRAAKRTPCDLITRGFTDSHAFGAVAWIPHELWVPFPHTRRCASRSPWITSGRIVPTASSSCFEAFFPPRVRSHFPELPREEWSLLSWSSAPLEIRTLQTSDPRPACILANSSTHPLPKDWTRDSRDRVDPWRQVKPPQNKKCTGSASSAVPSPLQDWTAPPLGGDSFSPDLRTGGHPPVLAFGASECLVG
jgi:hypothetical protein